MVTKLLKIEGLVVLLSAIFFYFWLDYRWVWLVVFFLAPDISLVGYLKNPRVGALIYNVGHSYILPLIILVLFQYLGNVFLVSAALIWIAHIGMDRFFGFGLKYPTEIRDTHLGRIGKGLDTA